MINIMLQILCDNKIHWVFVLLFDVSFYDRLIVFAIPVRFEHTLSASRGRGDLLKRILISRCDFLSARRGRGDLSDN